MKKSSNKRISQTNKKSVIFAAIINPFRLNLLGESRNNNADVIDEDAVAVNENPEFNYLNMDTWLPSYHNTFSIDNVIFGFDQGDLKILLIERAEEAFIGQMALPGNLVREDENLDIGAARILFDLTGLKDAHLEQLYTFGDVNRHPLGRVITVAYYSLIRIKNYELQPRSSFAKRASWVSVSELPQLAFDHNVIVEKALLRLRGKLRYVPIGFELLPEKFSLRQLQDLYECILQISIDTRNFRKKILSYDFLVELGEKQKMVSHRAAKLYRFDKKRYQRLEKLGFNFDL
jgi:8-oxo-dGTP diphosphatase